ncbi:MULTISPECIES: hypothetical protein [unclassified Nonomuraea]|uniref:hypothetical protein n=1 Tax=unclassified Nonomuraea TaxID=2593643 RepID=UPI0033DD13E2
MHPCATDPKASVDDVADQTVLNVLRMFGMDESEARRIVALRLPADEPPSGSI